MFSLNELFYFNNVLLYTVFQKLPSEIFFCVCGQIYSVLWWFRDAVKVGAK
jgi:hypothetical protein